MPATARPSWDSLGDLEFVGVVTNINSEESFRLIVETIPGLIAIMTTEGEVPHVNRRVLIVEYFIDRYARKAGKNITSVEKKTLQLLEAYAWPGNIRELQNVIERSLILCESEVLSVHESWLPEDSMPMETNSGSELTAKETQAKRIIEAALRECRGRVYGPSGAAAKLGIPRSTWNREFGL
jgi:transcriptional regulator of acetoin/glycerol metabolism